MAVGHQVAQVVQALLQQGLLTKQLMWLHAMHSSGVAPALTHQMT
jgi:hypothetical protein